MVCLPTKLSTPRDLLVSFLVFFLWKGESGCWLFCLLDLLPQLLLLVCGCRRGRGVSVCFLKILCRVKKYYIGSGGSIASVAQSRVRRRATNGFGQNCTTLGFT